MSTKDILKKSFLQSITSADITPQEIFLVLAIATVLSLYIYFIYKVLTRKAPNDNIMIKVYDTDSNILEECERLIYIGEKLSLDFLFLQKYKSLLSL